MKLEVKDGMFIRTKGGNLFKILDTEAEIKFRVDLGIEYSFYHNGNFDNEIIKSSHNIIDLIEVGDYVNGNKVSYIDDLTGAMRQFKYDYEDDKDCGHWQEEIKTILTKEQFENNCYKIGDE